MLYRASLQYAVRLLGSREVRENARMDFHCGRRATPAPSHDSRRTPTRNLPEASRLAIYVFKFDSPHCIAASFRDVLRLHVAIIAATPKPTILDARLHGDSDCPSGRRRVPTRRLTSDRRTGSTECECEMHLAEVGFQLLPSPGPVRLCQCDAAWTST